mmetsp:Transcript_38417/g.43077  ORF Transcript_38417/g.43077 Transcript_38417/m.43077 type:complete len:100 (+) Transcript_38417:80-379(+)
MDFMLFDIGCDVSYVYMTMAGIYTSVRVYRIRLWMSLYMYSTVRQFDVYLSALTKEDCFLGNRSCEKEEEDPFIGSSIGSSIGCRITCLFQTEPHLLSL